MNTSQVFDCANFLKEYVQLLYLIQETYKKYNPPKSKDFERDFNLVRKHIALFKYVWKLLQAKHLYPILRLIAFSEGINYNTLKDALPEINTQTLTTRLKQFQDFKFVKRTESKIPPVKMNYYLTDFGREFCYLTFPFFFFYNLKTTWKSTCVELDQNPPKIPLVDENQFPDVKQHIEHLPPIFQKSPYFEESKKVIFAALQMNKHFVENIADLMKHSPLVIQAMKNIQNTITAIQGKYFFEITYALYVFGQLSFNDLKKLLPEINSPILSTRLKEMEEMEIVARAVISENPLRVSYHLTEFGTGLICMFWPLIAFANTYYITER